MFKRRRHHMKLQNIRIWKRLIGGLSVLILIIMFGNVTGFRNIRDIDTWANEITDVTFQKIMLANTMLLNLQTISKETGRVVYTEDKSRLIVAAKSRKLYQDAMERFEKMGTAKGEN